MFMDISLDMVASLLPLFLVGTLGASVTEAMGRVRSIGSARDCAAYLGMP